MGRNDTMSSNSKLLFTGDNPAIPAELRPSGSGIGTGSRILFSRFFVIGMAAMVLFSRSRIAAPGSLASEAMLVSGLLLATVAMAGRMWCSLFIAGRKNKTLVTEGPYAMCRNPLYFFSLLGAVGVGLASGVLCVAAMILAAFAFYYPAVIKREEEYLRGRHGQAFEDYRSTIPGFWPRFKPAPVTEVWTCHPRVFLKHLGSAVWFPVACGLMHVLSVLHATGQLPVLIVWPF